MASYYVYNFVFDLYALITSYVVVLCQSTKRHLDKNS